MRAAAALALALAAPGCALDFDRFLAGAGDAAAPGDTGAAPDDTGRPPEDTGAPPRDTGRADTGAPTDAGPTEGGPCALPAILAAVENLDTGARAGGYVARYSLAERRRCADLAGAGALPQQPFAVAWLPPDAVVLASREEVDVLDATTGAVRARVATSETVTTLTPVDAFALETPDGPAAAVAYRGAATSTIARVRVVRDGRLYRDWVAASGRDLPSSNYHSMAASPLAADEILAARRDNVQTYSLRGLFSGRVTEALYADAFGAYLASVATSRAPHVTVWAGQSSTTGRPAIFYVRLPTTAPSYRPDGPRAPGCAEVACQELVRAVPDPQSDTNVVSLCATGEDVRRVVVRSSGAGCALLDSAALGQRRRIAYIAVAR